MNKKYICTIAVALFAIVSSFALFGLHDGMSEDADASDYIMTLPSDNLNIVVIGAGESANAILSKIGTMENVNATSDLKSNNFIDSTKTNAFIFTDSWIDENKSEAPKAVSDIVKNGSIVSFYKKQIDWSSTDLTVSYGYDDTMMSMCIVNGVSKCYSVTCDDSEEALSRTIQWMNSLVTKVLQDRI